MSTINVTVTHTLAPEVFELFKSILPSAKKESTADTKPAAKPRASAKIEEVETPKTEEVKTKTKTYSIEEVRALVREKSVGGKRDQIKQLLKEFNTESVTDMAEEHFSAFMEKLEKL